MTDDALTRSLQQLRDSYGAQLADELLAAARAELSEQRCHLESALAADDHAAMRRSAHSLKGTGGAIHVDELVESAKAAEGAEATALRPRIRELLAIVDHLDVQLTERRDL